MSLETAHLVVVTLDALMRKFTRQRASKESGKHVRSRAKGDIGTSD